MKRSYVVLTVVGTILLAWLVWPIKPAEPAKNILEGDKTERADVAAVVYPEAKKKLHLPKKVQADPAKKVTAATVLESDDRRHEVSAVLDTTTGQTTIYDRPLDRPWVEQTGNIHVGAFAGVYESGQPGFRVEARYEVVRVKAIRVGAVGSVDYIPSSPLDTRGFVGIGVWGSF